MGEKPRKSWANLATRVWHDPLFVGTAATVIGGAILSVIAWFIDRNRGTRLFPILLSPIVLSSLVELFVFVACLYVLLKKSVMSDLGSAQVPLAKRGRANRRHRATQGGIKVRKYSKLMRQLALAGLVISVISAASGPFIWRYYESLPSKKIVILVADFEGPPRFRVTQNIYESLAQATRPYPNLEVQLLDESISFRQGIDHARAIAAGKHAAILLWGSYDETGDSTQVEVNFEILPQQFLSAGRKGSLLACGNDSIHKSMVFPAEELRSFSLQLTLGRQLSALTMFTVGAGLYTIGEYDASISHFSEALKQWSIPGSIITPELIYFHRAEAYTKKADWHAAISDLGNVIELKPVEGSKYHLQGSAYNLRGNAFQNIGDTDKAIADYTEVTKLRSAICLACAYINLGNIHEIAHQWQEAVEEFSNAITVEPGNAQAHDGRGHAYVHLGEYDKGLDDLNIAIKLNPDDACYLNTRGEAFRTRGMAFAKMKDYGNERRDYDKAIHDYNEAIKRAPKPLFFKNRGQVFAEKQEYERAVSDYTQAVTLDPSDGETYHLRAHSYYLKGDYDEALADFSQAIALDPQHPDWYWDRARIYDNRLDDDRALSDYTRVIDLDPKDAGAYHFRGRVSERKGAIDAAIVDFTKAIELKHDHPKAYFDRADAFAKRKEYGKAIMDYTQAIKLDPNFSKAYQQRAHAYLNKGLADQAKSDISNAIARDPNNPDLYSDRAGIYENQGSYSQALADCELIINLLPNQADGYECRGRIYTRKSMLDQAVADLTKAINLSEFNRSAAESYFYRGQAFAMRKEPYKAIEDYRHALDEKEDYVEAFRNLGPQYLITGQYDLAIMVCDRLLELYPNDVDAYLTRGLAYEQKGDNVTATASYRALLRITKTGRSARSAANRLRAITGGGKVK